METQEKIANCAWCGKEPLRVDATHNAYVSKHGVFRCSTSDCVMLYMGVLLCCEQWNETQRAILARRRADFEAGWRAFDEGNRGHVDDEWTDYLSQPPADGERVELKRDIAEGLKQLDEGNRSEFSAEEIKAEGRKRLLQSKPADGER